MSSGCPEAVRICCKVSPNWSSSSQLLRLKARVALSHHKLAVPLLLFRVQLSRRTDEGADMPVLSSEMTPFPVSKIGVREESSGTEAVPQRRRRVEGRGRVAWRAAVCSSDDPCSAPKPPALDSPSPMVQTPAEVSTLSFSTHHSSTLPVYSLPDSYQAAIPRKFRRLTGDW